jgi:hypothetical protein
MKSIHGLLFVMMGTFGGGCTLIFSSYQAGSLTPESLAIDTAFFGAAVRSIQHNFREVPSTLYIDPSIHESAKSGPSAEYLEWVIDQRRVVLRRLGVQEIDKSSLGPCAGPAPAPPSMFEGCPNQLMFVFKLSLPRSPEAHYCRREAKRLARKGNWFIDVDEIAYTPRGAFATERTFVMRLKDGVWTKLGEVCVIMT